MTDNGGATQARGTGRSRRGRKMLLTAAVVTAAMASMAAAAPSALAESSGDEVPRTAEETLNALTGLLPSTLTYSDGQAEGVDSTAWPWASVHADDGSGGVDLQLSMNRWATDDWHDLAGCQGWGEPGEGFSCEETELSDGRILSFVTWQFGEPGDEDQSIEWQAWLEGPGGSSLDGPSGRAVFLSEYKDLSGVEDPEAYQPPVDVEQLAEVVQAPVWQQVFDAVDEEYGAPSDGEFPPLADIPSAALRDTFRQVAPEGLSITDGEEDQLGYATLQVDDGEGPGLIEITVHDPVAGEGDFAVSEEALASSGEDEGPQCEDTVLEDGTQVSACDWPPTGEDDPYDLAWVDVTYPDGTFLSISALNAPDWDSEPSRASAPLGTEGLEQIATDDAWRALLLED